MTAKRAITGLFILFQTLYGLAQEDFYSPGRVHEIRINFAEKNWKHLLDSLFIHTGDQGRLSASVIIDGELYEEAGVRYKGYSSYDSGVVKNPFNIDLDLHHDNQNHEGFTKIKLSNVLHDPSFIREVLSYEIARQYMPVSRAGYADLYINDTLIGLYTNVEAVDKHFAENRFGTGDNTFFKGEPETLVYPFGQNSNLALTHGSDSTGYIPYYKIESDFGWSELYDLIYRLDTDPGGMDSILNTDRVLWMHALNFTLLNLDSYIGYSQNYYLYRDVTGQFNPILWDLNMSFGSFRESDGSYHFQGLTIPEMKVLDPLEHLSFCISPRPLITQLIGIDDNRKAFLAHMRTILNENFRNGSYYTRGKVLQSIIEPYVSRDTNKFYSDEDFGANLDKTVGGTGSMIEYPGIKDLMEGRLDYLDTFPGFSGEPVISEVSHQPARPEKGSEVYITARAEKATSVYLFFRTGSTRIFEKQSMFDDGMHHDGAAGDLLFGAATVPAGSVTDYYIFAVNDSAAAFSPEKAAHEFFTIHARVLAGDFAINELNVPGGWIELYNTGQESLDISGLFLSDRPDLPEKWVFPDSIVPAHGYFFVETNDIVLQQEGGEILLTGPDGSILDRQVYGRQDPVKSFGRYPNGYGTMVFMPPTPSSTNLIGTTPQSGFILYPNPASTSLTLEMKNPGISLSIRVYNSTGQIMLERKNVRISDEIPSFSCSFDVSDMDKGLYFLQVADEKGLATRKFLID